MATQTQSNANGQRVHEMEPIQCNITEIQPDADAGAYGAKIDNVKFQRTAKDQMPMLIVDWKLTECKDDQDERNVDAVVSDFLAFFPDGDRRGNMAKQKARLICEAVGFDPSDFPSTMGGEADFKEVIRAWKGREIETLWVLHKADKETGETRVNVSYTPPKGSMATAGRQETEDDDRPRGKPAKTASKSKSARR